MAWGLEESRVGAWAVQSPEGLLAWALIPQGDGTVLGDQNRYAPSPPPEAMSVLSGHSPWTGPGLSGRLLACPGADGSGAGGRTPFPTPTQFPILPQSPCHRPQSLCLPVLSLRMEQSWGATKRHKHRRRATQHMHRGPRQADQLPKTPVGPAPAHTDPSRTDSHADTHTAADSHHSASASCPFATPEPLTWASTVPLGWSSPLPRGGQQAGRGKEPRRVRPSCH